MHNQHEKNAVAKDSLFVQELIDFDISRTIHL